MILQDKPRGPGAAEKRRVADVVLRSAVGCWFFVTLIGQWLFMYYIVAVYGAPTVSGRFEGWAVGYVPGDIIGNVTFAAHVLLAAVVSFGGMIQLIPQIRERAIAVHRWNGRAFLVAAAVVSIGGVYIKWVRNARILSSEMAAPWRGSILANAIAVSLNAVLILVFLVVAWRAARVRDIDKHRRWALRTFLVVNGSGFFIRVATAAWSVFAPGVGIGKFGNGPMDYFWFFAAYLLPLGVLEIYLRGRDSARPVVRFATALVVVAFTAFTIAGILVAVVARRKMVG